MELILSLLTDTQLLRMESKVWFEMTKGSGYQPFGYDHATMRITHPEEYAALMAVQKELKKRKI